MHCDTRNAVAESLRVSVRLDSLDWPVRALYTDSMATNGRAFSFADRSIHAHLSKRTVNFFCSHIAFRPD
jgi:hypothetical protein